MQGPAHVTHLSDIIFHQNVFFCDFWKETKNKQNLCGEREVMNWVKMVKSGFFCLNFFSIFVKKKETKLNIFDDQNARICVFLRGLRGLKPSQTI